MHPWASVEWGGAGVRESKPAMQVGNEVVEPKPPSTSFSFSLLLICVCAFGARSPPPSMFVLFRMERASTQPAVVIIGRATAPPQKF